jgi:hypothetical protein
MTNGKLAEWVAFAIRREKELTISSDEDIVVTISENENIYDQNIYTHYRTPHNVYYIILFNRMVHIRTRALQLIRAQFIRELVLPEHILECASLHTYSNIFAVLIEMYGALPFLLWLTIGYKNEMMVGLKIHNKHTAMKLYRLLEGSGICEKRGKRVVFLIRYEKQCYRLELGRYLLIPKLVYETLTRTTPY